MPTPQHPLPSGFSAAATAADVISGLDLRGQTAIVTGGYAGLGLETTRVLCAAGAHVVVPARDLTKATRALADLADVEIAALDLIDPASVRAFAEQFVASGRPLHLLINNAGIMAGPLARDGRGYEAQLATNHLGHFQLTAQLWPALRQANGARVVALSSAGHRFSPVVFEDVNFERRAYDPWLAYGQSKTANILFARALDARGQSAGVRAFAVHPGTIIGTDLARQLSADTLRQTGAFDANGAPIIDPANGRKTIAQGAATSVWCATSPQLVGQGGVYCQDCDIAPLWQEADAQLRPVGAGMVGVLPYAIDVEAAERLWTLSEQLTGVTLG